MIFVILGERGFVGLAKLEADAVHAISFAAWRGTVVKKVPQMRTALAAHRLGAAHTEGVVLMQATEPGIASSKLGQPEPESNLVSEVKSGLPTLGASINAGARLMQKRTAKRRLCFVCAHTSILPYCQMGVVVGAPPHVGSPSPSIGYCAPKYFGTRAKIMSYTALTDEGISRTELYK